MMTFLRFEITNAPSEEFSRWAFVEKADAVSAMIKKHLATLLCLLSFGFVPALAQQSRYPFNDPSLPMEKRIDNLLSLMTIDEKINCLSTDTGEEEERPDRCQQDCRLPALRLSAGVPHVLAGYPRTAPNVALSESAREADGADEEPCGLSVDGGRS